MIAMYGRTSSTPRSLRLARRLEIIPTVPILLDAQHMAQASGRENIIASAADAHESSCAVLRLMTGIVTIITALRIDVSMKNRFLSVVLFLVLCRFILCFIPLAVFVVPVAGEHRWITSGYTLPELIAALAPLRPPARAVLRWKHRQLVCEL